jgi:hypothetical protein
MAEQEPAAAGGVPEQPGTTRRGMLRGAAGIGAAGIAATVLGGSITGPAAAATRASAGATGKNDDKAAPHDAPLIAHVHDASTGVVDVYTGTRHVRFTDPQLAARISRAAAR